jgi:predicted Rossmann fold flavoprotein
VDLFAAEGVATKIEPGGKVFPASDRAADVRDALLRRLQQSGCELALGEPLIELRRGENGFRLVTPRRTIEAASVLLATGGKSYPACGTTGDGYRWAAALGHSIVEPRPALVPITSHATWAAALQGVTLPDVELRVIERTDDDNGKKEKCLARRRGSMLFAHFGLSGPAVLDVSRAVSGHANPSELVLHCDLLPDIKEAALETKLNDIIASSSRQRAAGMFDAWLPHRVGLAVLEQAGIAAETPLAELSKPLRRRAAQTLKRLEIPLSGTMGFRKAEVTAGGVALDEVDQRTMQSRLVPGLFFAGELLDLDGPVGGYNFQAAFSTGRLAGESMAR